MGVSKVLFPCKFIGITSGYRTSSRPNHMGIDMGWNRNYGGPNHPITAPFDGNVIDVKTNVQDGTGSSYGNYILLQSDYDKSITTMMGHLKYNSFKVKKGDNVKQGAELAKMGDTGNATGVHCHFEVRMNNNKVNPLLYTYATSDMTVAKSTVDDYKILTLSDTKYPDVNGVNRNQEVNQLQVLIANLRVRKTPTVAEDNQVGWASLNAYYNFSDQKNVDGYTWYQIGQNQWLAYKDDWVKIYPKAIIDDNQEELKQLQKEIAELEKQRDSLINDNLILKEDLETINLQLQEALYTKFKYEVVEDNNYQLKLNKGETLIIK